MADLSQNSAMWWKRVEWEARTLYSQWTNTNAINRGLLIPTMSPQLADVRFQRLESRAFSMLQAALPAVVKDELLATRTLTTVAALFVTLKLYAPGGLAERNELLDSLTHLGTAKTSQEAVTQIRKWHRCLARAQGMGVAVPDPARLIKALDNLSEPLLKKHVQVAFRLSQARTTFQLDHVPNMLTVQEFAKIMQSEWEMVAVSGIEEGQLKARMAKLDSEETKGGGKERKAGKGKGGREEGQAEAGRKDLGETRQDGKGATKGEGKICGFYLTPKGCSKGRACAFRHSFATAKGESRCYNCGSTEHRQTDCTRPQGEPKGGKGQGEGSGKQKGGGKTSSSTPLAAAGSTAATTSSPNPANANSTGINNAQAPSQQTNHTPAANPKAASSALITPQNGPVGPGGVPSVASAQAQVLEEAQKLLKSLRIASLTVDSPREWSPEKVPELERERERGSEPLNEDERAAGNVFVPAVSVRRARMPTGLLDGGATHPLRQATEQEWQQATPTRVALAVGTQDLRMSPLGTVLTQEQASPICPLGLIVELLGCQVTWNAGQCTVTHPVRGTLDVWLEGSCPTVSEDDCLSLIRELEQLRAGRLQQALHLRALSLGVSLGVEGTVDPLEEVCHDTMRWVRETFADIPDWLVVRSLPVPSMSPIASPYHIPGLNRRARKALQKAKHLVVHLFSGKTRPLEFQLGKETVVVNVDAVCGRDVLDERVFSALIALCITGKVDAVIGGPPCGTNSPLREQGRSPSRGDGGPRPVRGRTGQLRYGLPSNSEAEQKLVEDHSVLITRFLVLHHTADVYNPRGCLSALENPEDPHMYLPECKTTPEQPSIWAWPELRSLWNAAEGSHEADQNEVSEGEFGEGRESNQGRYGGIAKGVVLGQI